MKRAAGVDQHLPTCGWMHADRNGAVYTFRGELALNWALATRDMQIIFGGPILLCHIVGFKKYFEWSLFTLLARGYGGEPDPQTPVRRTCIGRKQTQDEGRSALVQR